MSPRDDATEAQVRAARPDASTWLAANAGSGKTRVLTDRVARLLLDGVQPQHILCLTYTKAAASEMQNRLFKRLGAWAMLPSDDLTASLRELGVEGPIGEHRLRDARTLFARAIETPGGLKIQTIHSFCASLLRRFPLEAQVSPQFTEIEDRAADLLRAEIVDLMADGPDAALIDAIARHYTGEDFSKLTRAVIGHRDLLRTPMGWGDILKVFDQPADLSRDGISASVFLGGEAVLIADILPALQNKGGLDTKAAEKLARIGDLGYDSLAALEGVFLFGATAKSPFGAKIGSFPTKPTQAVLSEHMQRLDDFMGRVEAAREPRLSLIAAEKTQALQGFAAQFIRRYEGQKLLRGWLDFDDLIFKARDLLNDPAVAAWVLFRIDGGIDHILVDEAQDTSPAQWDVIRKLAAEFSSGKGARDEARTLFVVGDKKQSIYSFQGADPKEFDRMEAEFRSKLQAGERDFQSLTLGYSFRSSEAVLDVVDAAFADQEAAGFSQDAKHIAFKQNLPGRVDIWPLVEKQQDADDRVWHEPLDRRSEHHHTVILAQQIAGQIKQMINDGQTIPVDMPEGGLAKRRVTAGDFLILVQRRSDLFAEIIRACKTHDLPIAGADRLKVGGELAVRDLAALLSFLAVAEDSLSLATALRSPLFGWSEQDLFTLAQGRDEKYLWQTLRNRAEQYPKTLAVLNDLRANVDFLRPYDLIERILTRHKGRRNLLSRLGNEAEDGINALLSQALAYERNAVPSLTGFLVWMETDDLEIKRQIDSASDQIRVMTVHGAKGLEAPIVILPDTGKRNIQIKDDIVKMRGHAVWKTSTSDMPRVMSDTLDGLKETQFEERLRLLYVALTRAEKWLIIAAAGELSKQNDSWYQIVDGALDQMDARDVTFQGLAIKRHTHAHWDDLPEADIPVEAAKTVVLEDLFHRPPPSPPVILETLSPSDLGGAKALPGEQGRDEEAAKAYGTLVHKYLEHLSVAASQNWPATLASLRSADPNNSDHDEAAKEARFVLQSAELANVFSDNSLAEVAVTAQIGHRRLAGIIDRLIITDTKILAVDFKTNQTVPAQAKNCPEGILRQMGAYAHALAQIYPHHKIRTAVLWTKTAMLMHLPHEIVTQALQSTQHLDVPKPRP
ncbi:RecBCD enzyme subunit RecB [Roseobacter fucihabitans]|uniref:DNA 3'-5' helicase n=1 Tax=Roseobacter fucihabitans TaxID=1537242 RepID=A0ABZ2BZX7_9RHOB|nr:double-strand break repair helicase AddA [Roseobacter litoralis]MBC6963886.1 ATP-dependent helicase/nuclease subunit A [Roseobacter litoralis]MBC6964029.1 ATP-dependent helicase/nuclease subunit A [Roseobacter litoralis]